MFNYAINGITIASILDTRRETVKGNYPVKIRVTAKRVRKYYSTGKTSTKNEWNLLPESKSKKSAELRKDIQSSFDTVRTLVQSLESEGKFSFASLNSNLGKCVTDTLNSAIKAKIKSLEEEGRAGTQLFYSCALSSIEKFEGQNLQFSDITVDWLKRYEKYMLKEGRSYSTIGMYLRALRTLMNDAKRGGIIKEYQYPFGKEEDKYSIPTGTGRKLALNLQQIKTIISYDDGNPTTQMYRDLWFFSYLCNGLNFKDLMRLKFSNIQNGEICFLRAKTLRTTNVKKEIQAILTPEMQAIIDRWGNKDKKPSHFIFPFLTGNETPMEERIKTHDLIHRTNKRLKVIGDSLGIDKLRTYSARHSFATVLKRSGANISFISESLGHADLKTTENYLASFEQDERIKNAAYLTNFQNIEASPKVDNTQQTR